MDWLSSYEWALKEPAGAINNTGRPYTQVNILVA